MSNTSIYTSANEVYIITLVLYNSTVFVLFTEFILRDIIKVLVILKK